MISKKDLKKDGDKYIVSFLMENYYAQNQVVRHFISEKKTSYGYKFTTDLGQAKTFAKKTTAMKYAYDQVEGRKNILDIKIEKIKEVVKPHYMSFSGRGFSRAIVKKYYVYLDQNSTGIDEALAEGLENLEENIKELEKSLAHYKKMQRRYKKLLR